MKFNFKNKVVLVTGGGSGIGYVTALAFVQAGARVIIFGRQVTKIKEAAKKISLDGQCEAVVLDVSKVRMVEKVLKNIFKKYKRIDVLVNCAGIYGPIGKHHENNLGFWKEAVEINLLGTVNCVHSVLPFMLKCKAGKIINLSGGGAVQPFPNFSAYATSKAAIVRYTENLAQEYKNNNIQINAIAPGAVNTIFLDQVLKAGKRSVGKDFYQKSLQQKQSGGDSPKIAAELILSLASSDNKLTGKLISAKWDAWQKFGKEYIKELNLSNEFTLRRIDNKYFKQV
jgi:3-oxoacyl-[acyl-carrier protein] reductase